MRTILEKKVVPSLEPLLENPKLEPELRNAIQDNLIVLLQRPKWEGTGVEPINNALVNNGANNENAHSGTTFPTATLPDSPIGGKEPPVSIILGAAPAAAATESLHLNFNLSPSPPPSGGILSPDIGAAALQSFPQITNSNNNSASVVASAAAVNATASVPLAGAAKGIAAIAIDQVTNNSSNNATSKFKPTAITFAQEPSFSDDDEDEDDDEHAGTGGSSGAAAASPIKPNPSAGAVPMRNSPTLATSVEEAERSKIFELVQQLSTNFRMPLDRLLDAGVNDREDDLDEVLEECSQQYDKEQRDSISKSLVYIFKSELNKPCFDDETDNLRYLKLDSEFLRSE